MFSNTSASPLSTAFNMPAVKLARFNGEPVVTFAIGMQVRLRLPRHDLAALGAGLALKLAVLPLAAWGLVRLLDLQGAAASATVFETAMPPMVTAGALASSHRLAPDLAAALVGYGVVLALGSLPLWRWLLA